MAAIQTADCKIEKASLENTSTFATTSSDLLSDSTPNNITGNNATRAGNTLMFRFTAYKPFDVPFRDFLSFCIPSTLTFFLKS